MSSPRTRLSKRQANPLPVHFSNEEKPTSSKYPKTPQLSYDALSSSKNEEVWEYLRYNRDKLEEYVLTEVPLDVIERWIIRKGRHSTEMKVESESKTNDVPASLSKWKFCVHSDKRDMLNKLSLNQSHFSLLNNLASIIQSAVSADLYYLYKLTEDQVLISYNSNSEDSEPLSLILSVCEGDSIAGYVAKTGHKVNTQLLQQKKDNRFPNGLGFNDFSSLAAEAVLSLPLYLANGVIIGVLDLIRLAGKPKFNIEEEEIASSYLSWSSVALGCDWSVETKLKTSINRITQVLLSDIFDVDKLLQTIADEAVDLVESDRSSIFLVDEPRGELYARVFGVSPEELNCIEKVVESSATNEGVGVSPNVVLTESLSYNGQTLRFPITEGIAGHVARTGEVVSCMDAQSDSRFNSQVDKITGYKTNSILCAPLKIEGRVIGVIEAINKKSGNSFTTNDKGIFFQFTEFSALAYNASLMSFKAKHSQEQYEVTMEMLAYHRQCTEIEITSIKEMEPLDESLQQQLLKPTFNTLQLSQSQLPHTAFLMFSELAHVSGLSASFDSSTVLRFILTVSKNYRPVPYHNWIHGFWVAQTMYAILSSEPENFPEIERIALFIACLCHDLDHRGYSNGFLVKSKAPLAALYSTSVMENHHFNQTLAILQTPGHNIFSQLKPKTLKIVLQCMENAIIATDLALLGENRSKIEPLILNREFNWKNDNHRHLGQALLMTACDLAATSKPWDMHRKTVDWLTQEFYKQGDEEKAQGFTPLELMDKNYYHKLPTFQIGFMVGISVPIASLISQVLPTVEDLAEGARKNIEKWNEILKEQEQKH